MQKFLITFMLIVASLSFCNAQTNILHDMQLWDQVLETYVKGDGSIDYRGLQQDTIFSALVDSIGSKSLPDNIETEEAVAYWLNVYNISALQLILEHYPLESISDLLGNSDSFGAIEAVSLPSGSLTFNALVVQKLLALRKDKRFYYALFNGSYTSPNLYYKAFAADKLETQLEELSYMFINNGEKNDIKQDVVYLNPLFNEHKKLYETEGGIVRYLNKYNEFPINSDAKVLYLEPNWGIKE